MVATVGVLIAAAGLVLGLVVQLVILASRLGALGQRVAGLEQERTSWVSRERCVPAMAAQVETDARIERTATSLCAEVRDLERRVQRIEDRVQHLVDDG